MKSVKNFYENAEMHILLLEDSDVIATSGTGNGSDDTPGSMDGGGWDTN